MPSDARYFNRQAQGSEVKNNVLNERERVPVRKSHTTNGGGAREEQEQRWRPNDFFC